MTIDTRTGLVAASTGTTSPGPGIVPESVPGHRVTTSITVVDSAPTTGCGVHNRGDLG